MDLCGPFKTPTLSGNRYFHSIVDHGSNYACIFPIRSKDADITLNSLRDFIIEMKQMTDRTIKKILTDNGGEFTARIVANFMNDNLIKHVFTIPDHRQTNRVTE
jgi:Integrase core domain